jgi:hypothetical protein
MRNDKHLSIAQGLCVSKHHSIPHKFVQFNIKYNLNNSIKTYKIDTLQVSSEKFCTFWSFSIRVFCYRALGTFKYKPKYVKTKEKKIIVQR